MNKFCAQWDGPGDPKFVIAGMEDSGKVVPYIGWFWREVPFDSREYISLGHIPGGFIGFMMNNKWGYDEWTPSEEQYDGILRLLHVAMANTNDENLQALFEFMQECKPDWPLTSLTQHRQNEQWDARKYGEGPIVFLPDAELHANVKTEELCPDCQGEMLWSFTGNTEARICYCGYKRGVDDIG